MTPIAGILRRKPPPPRRRRRRDRYQLDYCRDQVGELMGPIEVLVLAGCCAR
jgi:hypothetical protein